MNDDLYEKFRILAAYHPVRSTRAVLAVYREFAAGGAADETTHWDSDRNSYSPPGDADIITKVAAFATWCPDNGVVDPPDGEDGELTVLDYGDYLAQTAPAREVRAWEKRKRLIQSMTDYCDMEEVPITDDTAGMIWRSLDHLND